ncbi:uncharacterized protein HMPREF1541_03244 [Cyphellophora europaea CBS 101466]|uniref:Anaphase-promoting complex subunit 1 N-terminal domain-containing protein n=1 Tax=Cyphellophora europaea (strain CBS 101466) TaxID=1220924 RepID=W2S032_CYPE1|nr:uncharacterized protein HMPREF1541_03244 [Cyphellophora europaea CBS 101466]ETN41309.1 hypothetical protein HMPREF1541_03244 [Cyphellophora europaea CBS 101466]
MATVRSLGVHEPTALPYLIAEGTLPSDPSPETYRYHSYLTKSRNDSELVEEEILIADSCVVWSKCGVIKRVLNLSIEDDSVLQAFTTFFPKDDLGSEGPNREYEEALVVVLKSQVHILLVSGDSHLLPLSFEAQSAFACPNGFLLQRRVASEDDATEESTIAFHHDLSTINESQGTIRTSSARPSLVLPDITKDLPQPVRRGHGMPRTFSCVETMSELGLVVFGSTDRAQSLDDCQALPTSETLLYISRHDELRYASEDHESLCISVTYDPSSDAITIWHVAGDVPLSARTKSKSQKQNRKSATSKRKSSNIYGRNQGAATPAALREPHPLRQSFTGLAQSYAEGNLNSSAADQRAAGADELANQLGPEFEQVGVQTRSARRVSSMLARTDLGAVNDRNTFHDLAVGHNTRKSVGRGPRRGESIGSFSDRQSFGIRRRSSFHAATSILSTGTSFLNVPGQLRVDDVDSHHHLDMMSEDLLESTDLRRDLGFFKLTSFSLSEEGSSESQPDLKVLTIPTPKRYDEESMSISVCVHDHVSEQIAIVDVHVDTVTAIKKHKLSKKIKLKATSIRRGSSISGVCLVNDDHVQRLLILTKTRQGDPLLHLEAPWSPSFRMDLPSSHLLSDPLDLLVRSTPTKKRDEGLRRTIPASSIEVASVYQYGRRGRVALVSPSGRAHTLLIKLRPADALVSQILTMCDFVLGKDFQDCMLVAFWEVQRWLSKREAREFPEWTSLVVTLFTLAAPFIDEKHSKSGTPSRRKRGGLLRSASGTAIDLSNFNAMKEAHTTAGSNCHQSTSWQWLIDDDQRDSLPSPSPRSPRHARSQSQAVDDAQERKDSFILQCIGWAREFVQSPAGEATNGPEGYLPVSINKERSVRQTALAKILVGIHLLYEEHKLMSITDRPQTSFESLPGVMSQLGLWLGWQAWTMHEDAYYVNESSSDNRWLLEDSRVSGLEVPDQPFEPPSILQYLCQCVIGDPERSFPTLDLVAEYQQPPASDAPSDAVLSLTPHTHMLTTVMNSSREWTGPLSAYEHFRKLDLSGHPYVHAPDGFAAAFRQALASIRTMTPDLLNIEQAELTRPSHGAHRSRLTGLAPHAASKDYHAASVAAFDAESIQRWDVSSELDRQAVTKLVFQDDRRFQEASKLVNQTRPPLVTCIPEPDWTEADLLEAQKELAQLVARRTLSVASGRAMMHFSARIPLLTERVPIPAFSLQCLMSPRSTSESAQPMTFSADKSAFTEEKVCWAFFHNGASAGLMISKHAKCIDTSWILYNKPQELTNRHAGFLLALGLNGHLRSLAKWVAFKYLTPKHTMTSIGLLLGLSASYLGTQDQLITRLLSVHVTRLLPPGAAELNLSPLTQTTGIMGIGLLYYNSQHRRMSDMMLSEIENNDSEEGMAEELVLRDEGYRLAAGFSLGLMNLGLGNQNASLHDLSVPERLLAIAVGTKNVNLVHVLDRATAGAVMAVAFMFMKTNDAAVARKIDIPETLHQFDYVRPDIFLLRTLARHLIMWEAISPTQDFVTASLPKEYRHRASLQKTVHLATEDMPFFNILAGICFALGLRYAGSQRYDVRDLLVSYLDHFLRLSHLPCPHYDARVTLNSVRNCLDVVALATATVMAGSGDLIVMRRLRSLHGRTDKDTPFGSHMAAHMALGVLFLGGGTMTFGTSNLAIASLCIAFYPLFPGDVLDNKAHLQALRHLWVLAVEGRSLVCRQKEGGDLVAGLNARVELKSGESVTVRSPGLLPDFDSMKRLHVAGEGWWDVTLDFTDDAILNHVKKEGAVNIWLQSQADFDRPTAKSNILFEELRVLDREGMRGANGVPSVIRNFASRTHPNALPSEGNPFEWLFDLRSFQDYDAKERDLVLDALQGEGKELLNDTPVDSRLALERGLLPEDEVGNMSRSKLWELRALLTWFDRFEMEDEAAMGEGETKWSDGLWVRREVVERLRERVWDTMVQNGSVEA